MKCSLAVFFSVLMMITAGCSSSKNMNARKSPKIVKAGYHPWSHAPIQGTTLPEGGVDLTLVVKNLPAGAEPQAVIYQHYKSFKPIITDTTKAGIKMKARILTSSSVMRISPKKDQLSDRLIYKADSAAHFITIKNWKKVKK